MRTALIATVLNEAAAIDEFLRSMEAQTRTPDVIVVTDGGSTDGTLDRLAAFAASTSLPFQHAEVPGNRSVGRNEAIRVSEADVIAVTDVTVLDPAWFETIVAPLEAGEADVVAGWYEVLATTKKERAVGLLTQFSPHQVDPDTFLPSSRSIAFTRSAWEAVGGYPEAYAKNEDTVFDIELRRAGLRFAFAPDAVARWRPPAS
ncbi:MAG: glycosyltransferase, partial [Thermoplasmata archaeon]|nr:glycosyltransferase [Thermoplasmata archaeon]